MAGAPVLFLSAPRPVPPHWTGKRECEGPGTPPPGPSARPGAGTGRDGAPVPSPSGRQLLLAAHAQDGVMVEVGGGLRLYGAGGLDVLDSYGEDEVCSGGRGQFLAPWPNRLGDGAFEWQGHGYQTALSEPSRHNAIHGLVRWANW